ncbi:MAG TPA: hypothetical protein VLE73_05515 [Candidatus Saccharimonadales bacterium]|nr:hypothetical protein [Candidatus Saccharimonadales bacterium]
MKRLRRQLEIDNPNQLHTPSDLYIGQDIARLAYMPGLPTWMRAVRAYYAFARAQYQDKTPRQQVASARKAWTAEGEGAFCMPLWRGCVETITSTDVTITLTHGQLGLDYHEWPNDLAQIPPLGPDEHLFKRRDTLDELGLSSLPNGRWLPYVTVAFPPETKNA